MDKENNHIDDLFSDKFDNLEFKTSPEEWSNISSSLGKVNFFKFSFTSVNVYIVGAGVALASSGGYVGVKHIVESNKTEETNNKIELVEPPKKIEEKALISDSSTFVIPIEAEKIEFPKEENKIAPLKKTTKVVKEETKSTIDTASINQVMEEELSITETDSTSLLKPDSSLIEPPRKVIRVKRKIFIKKDSVIQKKTVIIKK